MGWNTGDNSAEPYTMLAVPVYKNGEMESFDGEGSWRADIPDVVLYAGASAN